MQQFIKQVIRDTDNVAKLSKQYAKGQRQKAKAITTPIKTVKAPIEKPKEIVLDTPNYALDDAVDNHLTKKRGTVNVAMPLNELELRLTEDLKRVGLKGEINLLEPTRRAGPLGEGQTLYRNYQEAWMKQTDRPQKESLYAELDGERFFGDVKEKKKRLAIRNVRQKLDETALTMSSRDLAIIEQTLDEKDLKSWNRSLQATPRGWEAHHLNMIKLMSNLTEGLGLEAKQQFFKHLSRRYGLSTGNSVFNKVNLPYDIHDWVHAEMTKIGLDYRKVVFNKNTPMKTRLKYMQLYAKKMDHIQRYIYKKMSARKSVRSRLTPESRQFRSN